MMESSCGSSVVEPPISPRSPPGGGLDLYGKRRQMVKVQALEREIGLLQEELKSIEDLQPASKCCKELDDFVGAKLDPFIAVNEVTRKSKSFWKRLWSNFCTNFLCICCSSGCLGRLQKQNCSTCCAPFRSLCHSCSLSRNVTCPNCCKGMGLSCLCHACCCFESPIQCNLCSNFAKCCHNSCCL